MMAQDTPHKRPKEVAHDETPSGITDHPFQPKHAWWSLCGYPGCNLAQSAHAETTVPRFHYYSDDVEDHE
jgi:hypothetical protein